jgi:hypothetical protein
VEDAVKCTRFKDDCPDAEWCQQGGSCDVARRLDSKNAAPDEQAPSGLILGVPVGVLLVAGTVAAIIAAVQGSPWWLVLPVVAFAALALILSRPYRRDEQLAQIVGLHELPRTDEVDRELLDPAAWEHALWVDPNEEMQR